MPTLVTSSIGTGARTYPTVQLWEDAIPANLVTGDVVHRGEVYNDSGAQLDMQVDFSAHTTDATRYVHLTAATGQSFQDKPTLRASGLLGYDASVYAAIGTSNTYRTLIGFSGAVDYFTLERMQLRTMAGNSQAYVNVSGCNHHTIKDCLITCNATGSSGGSGANEWFGTSTKLINVVACQLSASGTIWGFRDAVALIDCKFVHASNVSPGTANGPVALNYATPSMTSTAVFGYTVPAHTVGVGAWSGASKNNATNVASGLPGTSNQHAISYSSTTPFEQASDTGTDLRPIAGTALAANGFLDATNAPNDISGFARSATPTIGAWELGAAPRRFILVRP